MLTELVSKVEEKYPGCYLTLHYKEGWSIRDGDQIKDYGHGFYKLYEALSENSYDKRGSTTHTTGEVETPIFSDEEEQDSFDWLELVQDAHGCA